jgi:hypothetical protein
MAVASWAGWTHVDVAATHVEAWRRDVEVIVLIIVCASSLLTGVATWCRHLWARYGATKTGAKHLSTT